MGKTLRFITIFVVHLHLLMDGQNALPQDNFIRTKKSNFLQAVNPESYRWGEITDPKKTEFLKIDELKPEKLSIRKHIKSMSEFIRQTESLQTIWIPGHFLSDELISKLIEIKSLQTVFILDPIDTTEITQKLSKSQFIKLIVLARHRTKFGYIEPDHSVNQRIKVIEVRLQEDNEFFNRNGCLNSSALEDYFGMKFENQTSRR